MIAFRANSWTLINCDELIKLVIAFLLSPEAYLFMFKVNYR